MSILIVDDSLTVRMDLADAFEAEGFQVVPCADGARARAALANSVPALIVLDVVLPDTDGLELLKEIRAQQKFAAIPVLMLSSEADVKDRIKGLKSGATEYVGKPYDTHYVVARTRELLGAKRAAPEQATILLIDDSPTFRAELGDTLSDAGYRVITAENGEDGLRLAAIARPAAVVVDGVMPGIDGATVIRRIRLDTALRDMPCVLLTASEDHGSELRALDAGADAFVRKEGSLDVILARIAVVLRSAQRADYSTQSSALGPKKILAVDDSPSYLQEVGEVLGNQGYDVVLARSGEEALEMLAVQPVDCILMDLMMPGIGGQEACRQIKLSSVVRDIPLIMLTAIEDRNVMLESLAAGADDFIQKTGEFEVLKARVRAQIRRKQIEDEHRRIREELLHREREAIEAQAAQALAEARMSHMELLERKNKELEAFSYSVSHDLRAPLRAIDGFSLALLEEFSDKLDATGREYLDLVRSSAQRMRELIDDLLQLSQVTRHALRLETVNVVPLVQRIVDALQRDQPHAVHVELPAELIATADERLLCVVLENLVGNAWKFTRKTAVPAIAIGTEQRGEETVYFVRDNGAGFSMQYAEKLFQPFQRLHAESDFPGTGIGLTIVQRIVDRHGGRIWAEADVGRGASFLFTLGAAP